MAWARGSTAVVVALVVVAFGAWLLGWSPTLNPIDAILGRPATVQVPDLSGLAKPRALADVASARLRAEVHTAFSLTVAKGAVVSQKPKAGRSVPAGSTVDVVVSRGVSRVEMPDAVGHPIDEVVKPLKQAGVDYAVREVPSEDVVKGLVIEQTPDPGVVVTASDEIRFVVSAGAEPRPVPTVAGLSIEGAAFALGRAGFLIQEITPRDDADVAAGVVVSTDPPAGEVSDRDTKVRVVVSAGPPPVAVPDVLGTPLVTAVERLEAVGLVPNVSGGSVSGGSVTVEQPEAGTELRPGELVAIEVGGG